MELRYAVDDLWFAFSLMVGVCVRGVWLHPCFPVRESMVGLCIQVGSVYPWVVLCTHFFFACAHGCCAWFQDLCTIGGGGVVLVRSVVGVALVFVCTFFCGRIKCPRSLFEVFGVWCMVYVLVYQEHCCPYPCVR